MVIFYDIDTHDIVRTEDNVMTPSLPVNASNPEKIAFYTLQKEGFVSIPYELGIQVWDYNLCFDDKGVFIGIQPITKGGKI